MGIPSAVGFFDLARAKNARVCVQFFEGRLGSGGETGQIMYRASRSNFSAEGELRNADEDRRRR